MIALIDGDLVAYRCAASCEKQGVVTEDIGIAQARAHNLIVDILAKATNGQEHHIFLSGGENFRKTINPQYKANRDDVPRPAYLEPLREWLVVNWQATVTDGIEADDALGIAQTTDPENSIICSLDKDLRQVPGHHYAWEIVGTSSLGNKWKKEASKIYVSPQEGLFNFYWQFIMGDAADNIFGFDGKCRAKVPKFLEDWYMEMQGMTNELELFDFVRDKYNDDDRFLMNGACLWVQRTKGDNWLQHGKQLLEQSGTEDSGLRAGLIPL
jgi:hypothetical protein